MRFLLLILALLLPAPAIAQDMPPILPLRERARVQNAWLAERLDSVVPRLMGEQRIDMWVLIAREYLEDPVMSTMLNAESMRARRRTILVFFDPGGGRPVERLTVSRYGMGGLFRPSWDPAAQPDQFVRLASLIAERDPRRIAVNISPNSAFADGLTHSQYEAFMAALPEALRRRVTATDALAIGWLETRIPAEMARYPEIVRIAHRIIAEGFSNRAIRPGVTTAADLVWWYRERIAALGLATWFHPSVAIFRRGAAEPLEGDAAIQPGDMLWTDFGIAYLGLNTDTQQLAYVLRPGETEAPAGLAAGLADANRAQDVLLASFRTGLSGNEILAAALERARAAGLRATIYSHPLGYHGHGAGAAIGFWDNQAADPRGNHRLRPDTAWSIELNVRAAVPEWGGQEIEFRLEEDAFFDGREVSWLDGRQTEFHLIRAR
ncbi:MAG TPA: M24 family metallopeptidase [Allosphingosinicella sp.]|nr:M24 family metallopeptidase [Allosphingosinicella sp.]